MKFPTVHLNGTHGPDLEREYEAARGAVWHALEMLQVCGPHGRDYLVPGET